MNTEGERDYNILKRGHRMRQYKFVKCFFNAKSHISMLILYVEEQQVIFGVVVIVGASHILLPSSIFVLLEQLFVW